MSGAVRKQEFLTAAEFSLCCAAAGLRSLPCFAGLPEGAVDFAGAACDMANRGLLEVRADGFVLSPALSGAFRTVRESANVALVFQQRFDMPYALLYGTPEALVSLQPGRRAGEYLGLTRYRADEAAEWLEDMQLILGGNLPDELLEAVSDREREADLARNPALGAFLLRYAREEAAGEPVPPGLTGCVECRRVMDLRLLGRVLFVRLPLYDHLIVGSAEGVRAELCRAGRAAEAVCAMLTGGMI